MKTYPDGVRPVMLTPYLSNGSVDHEGLKRLSAWYASHRVDGLFAACQSSEIFHLSALERAAVVSTVVRAVDGAMPVVASGHVSERVEDTLEEMRRMEDAGADAFILISNRLATHEEKDDLWLERMGEIVGRSDMDLGIYECPYPYKRLLSLDVLKACAQSNRFFFLKDTCCDAARIAQRADCLSGSTMKLFNANSATLLASLRSGAAGFSGIMANFHPELYVWLCRHPWDKNAQEVQHLLTLASMAEHLCYPVCAKYHLKEFAGLPIEISSKTANAQLFTPADREIVRQIAEASHYAYSQYCGEEDGK